MMIHNQKGFLLISIIFIMILMAVSIFSINYYAITQIRMSSNRAASVQTAYDLHAIVEESIWKLTDNLFWRTVETGEDVSFNGTTYTRIARDADTSPFNYPSDYDDAVTVQVIPKGSSQSLQRSFRYYASVFAGNGSAGSLGDGGAATSARLNQPRGLFVDASGNLFIADTNNHKIRKVNGASGIITTIAGTGIAGDIGDAGAATSARLNTPRDVFGDTSGNIFIADTGNHRIRKVDGVSGIITTIAGKNSEGYDGDDKVATSAKLWYPNGIFVDSSGNFYIADTDNHRIRKVDTSGIITTVAGTGFAGDSGDGGLAITAMLNYPRGVFGDTSGNLYIADTENHKVRKLDISTGVISTVAGTGLTSGALGDGGPATSAKLMGPLDLCVDPNGHIFIVDWDNNRIRVVNAMNGHIDTLTGMGASGDTQDVPAVLAQFNYPGGITMASSYGGRRIYISDTGNHKIKVLLFKPVYGF